MQQFSFHSLELEGAFLIKPFVAYDERGYLIKDYSCEAFEKTGIQHNLREVFYTSSKKGVIRAIHFQRVKEQPKLVRCVFGKIFDVIVDLRRDSPTLGKWLGLYLSEENKDEIYIPKGFGHGYLVIEPAIVSYKCSELFYGEYDDGIVWNDTTLAIDWPLHLVEDITISEKDKSLQTYSSYIVSNER